MTIFLGFYFEGICFDVSNLGLLDYYVGIYREYEDTKDAIKEKKIDTGFSDEERRLAKARAQATDKGFTGFDQ